MSRLINRPIHVTTENGNPHTIVDGDYTYMVVEIIDEWRETVAWWDSDVAHHVWRVYTSDHSLLDIDQVGDDWFLYRVWD